MNGLLLEEGSSWKDRLLHREVSTPPAGAVVGKPLSYNAENSEEGASGAHYSLAGAPEGMSVDAITGRVDWTPEADDLGPHPFSVIITDAAGNSRSQDVEIDVDSPPAITFRVETTDDGGTPLSSIAVGDEFNLRVYVEDVSPDPHGVFSAFIDLMYDETLVAVEGALEYGSDYPNSPDGDLATPGLIDEVGALAGIDELGGGEFLLFGLPMQAIHAGTAVFESEAADELPAHELLTFGGGFDIEPEQVTYGSTSLTINPAFGSNDDIFNVDEDSGATSLDVLANDEAFEGSTGEFTIVDVTEPSESGTATITSDDQYIEYVPADDFFGEETFTYTVSDGTGTDTALVTVQVMSQNDNPTAHDDEVVVMEDTVDFVIDVLDNDSIAPDENETLSIIGFDSLSSGGSVNITDEGDRLLYSPAPDYAGVETFNYTIDDGNGGTDTATVTVTIMEENDPPEAVDDSFEVVEDSTDNSLDVLANDTTAGDPDESLTIVGVSDPDQGGTVAISQDELTLIYTPEADFFGDEQFTYEITDGNGGFAEATGTVTVTGVNDPPTAQDDTFTVVKGETDILLSVLDNDSSEPDGVEEITVSGVEAISGDGSVTVTDDGQGILYSPDPGFTGDETFIYTIEDPEGATSQATVAVTVLDYIPSTLSGHVYLDVDNDGVKDDAETPLGGVIVTLAGTDMFGDPVERQQTTNALGYYQFGDLVPGSYEVSQTPPQFLIDGMDRAGAGGALFSESGTDTLPIELEQDADVTGFDFGERGLEPSRITIVDLFASTRANDSVLMAANSSDNSHWYAIERGWRGTQSLNVDLNEGMSNARLDLTTTDAQQSSTTVDLTSRSQARRLAGDGHGHLWRVSASRDQIFDGQTFDAADTGSPDTAEGCEENDPGCSTTSTIGGGGGGGDAEGEGEAQTVATTVAAEGEAPLPADMPELNARPVTEPPPGLPRPPVTAPHPSPESQQAEGENAGAQAPASSTPANSHAATDLLMAEPNELFSPLQAADQLIPFSSVGASTFEDNDSFETAIDLLMGEPEESGLLVN
ncbi:MAG: Ig-like domain-containing protein [Pirellulaceae bacterium]